MGSADHFPDLLRRIAEVKVSKSIEASGAKIPIGVAHRIRAQRLFSLNQVFFEIGPCNSCRNVDLTEGLEDKELEKG